MTDYERAVIALQNADKAGDVEAARALADHVRALRAGGADRVPQNFVQRVAVERGTVAPKAPAQQDVNDTLRAAAQGATFGFSDEAIAAGKAAVTPETYDDALKYERSRLAAMPAGRRLAAELVGGVTTGGLGAARTSLARLPGVLRYPATGAAAGAIAGAGVGEGGAMERAGSAAEGAAIGGVVGGATGVLGAVADRGRRLLKGEASKPLERIGEAIEADMMTPDRLMARYRALGEGGMLADAGGGNVQGLARAVASVPGPGQQIARTRLNARASKQNQRITETIDRVVSGDDFATTRDRIIADRASEARDAYTRAGIPSDPAGYAASPVIDTPQISKLLENDRVRRAIATAKADNPAFADLPDNSMVLLDQAYKHIGDIASDARSSLSAQGKSLTRAHNLDSLRTSLRDAITDVNPAYGAALDSFAGQSALKDALEAGRKFAKQEADLTAKQVGNLSQGEKDMFLAGVARALTDVSDATRDRQNAVMKIFGTPTARAKLQAAFPDHDSYRDFARRMVAENRMSGTREMALGGSPTARIQAEQGALGAAVGDIAGSAMGNRFAIASLARRILGARRDLTPEENRQLATLLFSPLPERFGATLQGVQANRDAANAALRRRIALSAGTSGPAAAELLRQ